MKFLDYVFAARPMLHLPIWSIYLVALHYHHQLSGGGFGPGNLAVIGGLSLLAAGAYYLNQIFDIGSDAANQKLGFLQSGLVSIKKLLKLLLILSVLAIAFAVLYSKVIFFIFIQLFGLGVMYSAPPLRLKDRAVSGLLANAYSFGFLISISVMPNINQHNAGLLGWDNPFYFFLAVMGLHILTTLTDVEGDRAVGKKTIAVVLPRSIVVLLALFAFSAAGLVAFNTGIQLLVVIAAIAAIVTLVSLFRTDTKIIKLASKLPITLLTLLAGYFYPFYLLFVVATVLATRAYYKRRFNLKYPTMA
ncbi:MAG: UbiA family prenyltransferase [Candidatus Zixiibacteriota bacterium]